jgi:hypothetical protein
VYLSDNNYACAERRVPVSVQPDSPVMARRRESRKRKKKTARHESAVISEILSRGIMAATDAVLALFARFPAPPTRIHDRRAEAAAAQALAPSSLTAEEQSDLLSRCEKSGPGHTPLVVVVVVVVVVVAPAL